MKNGLYHRDLGNGIPLDSLRGFGGNLNLDYSAHARWAAMDDRYSSLAPWQAPRSVKLIYEDVIEANIQDDVAVKIVVRLSLDAKRDIVLVLNQPNTQRRAFVRTLWLNLKSDQHATLDSAKYVN